MHQFRQEKKPIALLISKSNHYFFITVSITSYITSGTEKSRANLSTSTKTDEIRAQDSIDKNLNNGISISDNIGSNEKNIDCLSLDRVLQSILHSVLGQEIYKSDNIERIKCPCSSPKTLQSVAFFHQLTKENKNSVEES